MSFLILLIVFIVLNDYLVQMLQYDSRSLFIHCQHFIKAVQIANYHVAQHWYIDESHDNQQINGHQDQIARYQNRVLIAQQHGEACRCHLSSSTNQAHARNHTSGPEIGDDIRRRVERNDNEICKYYNFDYSCGEIGIS